MNGSDRTALAIGSKYFDEEEQKELLIVWLYSWNKHYEACVMQMAQYIKSLAVDYVYYEDNGGNHLLLKKELSSYGIIGLAS